MIVKAYKTSIIKPGDNLFDILDEFLPKIEEKSVIAVSSKIVAICEGRIVKIENNKKKKIETGVHYYTPSGTNKDKLIESESQYYIPRESNPYGVSLTITRNILAAAAGIDESNANGYYILWPKNPQKSVNQVREYLCKKFNRKYIGVILTDSKTTPMRWGVTGVTLSYSGFIGVNSYVGEKDLFGRELEFTRVSVMDNLASAAILTMGESNEQKPLAVITDLPMVKFQDRNPTQKELDEWKITIEEDLYGEFLKNAPWKKGKAK